MSRIENKFKSLNRPAFVTFITAGDPNYEQSLKAFKALPAAGADIIELGMPFSDPMADGPVIQMASERALESGANMKRTLQMVRDFRKSNQDTPLILMGYINPIFSYGIEAFARDAKEAGVDGLIIVDMPPEEDAELLDAAKAQDLDMIRLVTPTTDEARLPKVLDGASGFLYYVSITGVTGTAKASPETIKPHLDMIRTYTDLPIAIGFGIKTPKDVKSFSSIANAVVVGSAIVQTIADNQNDPNLDQCLSQQVKTLTKALKN